MVRGSNRSSHYRIPLKGDVRFLGFWICFFFDPKDITHQKMTFKGFELPALGLTNLTRNDYSKTVLDKMGCSESS
ncbi:hypothetical protein SUGI_0205660 [Cryptomeria japonica]|nr:hypothetical protein SUGI_0205660 [Cryptomeria japonica]